MNKIAGWGRGHWFYLLLSFWVILKLYLVLGRRQIIAFSKPETSQQTVG